MMRCTAYLARKLLLVLLVLWLGALPLFASELHGQVLFNGLPVPGVTVTAVRDAKSLVTITDQRGAYSFADLEDGSWKISVSMLGFATQQQEVVVGPNAAGSQWELKLLPLDEIKAQIQQAPVHSTIEPAGEATERSVAQQATSPRQAATRPTSPSSDDELGQSASDGFLINGSTNNGAASPFAQLAAFGNNRSGSRGLYNGGIGIIFDNSALDARPFSLTGQSTAKPAYNRVTGVLALGGPLQIPHLFKRGPNFFVNYQWTRNQTDTIATAVMPGSAERSGIFSSPIIDPSTGMPFANNTIPKDRISPQAQALLNLYPLPNLNSNRYNYEIPTVSDTHQDALQSRIDKTLNPRNQLYGRFAFQSTRSGTPNVFGFLDTTDLFGINTSVNWSHRL